MRGTRCRYWPRCHSRWPCSRSGPRPASACTRTGSAMRTATGPGSTPGGDRGPRCPPTVAAVPVPARLPEIAWRTGIDLDPVDVGNADEMRWLEALVWPEQEFRRDRLKVAAGVARCSSTPHRRGSPFGPRGDGSDGPERRGTVVFRSAVLAYLDADDRATFARLVQELPGHWIANEGVGVLPYPDAVLPVRSDPTRSAFVIAQDGTPVAHAGPHGEWLDWFGGPDQSAGPL